MEKKLCLLLLIILPGVLVAQENYDEFVRQGEREFEEFERQTEAEYQQYIKETDAEFAQYLRETWSEYDVEEKEKKPEKPKPVTFPPAENETKPAAEELELNEEEALVISDELVMPTNYSLEDYRGVPAKVSFTFFGEDLTIRHDPQLKIFALPGQISSNTIADFWENISNVQYQATLEDLWYYQERFALNDYGFYLLVKDFAAETGSNTNSARLLTWFLMTKAKYKVRIGFNQNQVYLMMPSTGNLYGISYLNFNGTKFYVFDYQRDKIYSYNKDYKNAYKSLDLTINKPLNLPERISKRSVSFVHDGSNYNFSFQYNRSAIDFFNSYPQASLDVYFNSVPTTLAKESIIENLKPAVENMSETDALSFLLKFIQVAFPYKIDDEQFGKEKVFFPEEMLHYPYSDCEDRSILFAYLVGNLLGNEVIALDYPEHVATAVNMNSDIRGDFYVFQNRKYIVCDPTYINAPVGMAMSQFASVKADPIWIQPNTQPLLAALKNDSETSIMASLADALFFSTPTGKLALGAYKEDLSAGTHVLQSENQSSSIYLSMVDRDEQVKWLKDIGDGLDNFILGSKQDDNDNLYVLHESRNPNSLEINRYLTRFDSQGNQLWKTKVPFTRPKFEMATMEATLLDKNGKILAREFFGDTEFFTSDKLNMRGKFLLVTLPVEKELIPGMETRKTASSANFNFTSVIKSETDKLLTDLYEKNIAPILAFITLVQSHGFIIEGAQIQAALDRLNPNFKSNHGSIYDNIGTIRMIKNSSGVVTFNTGGKNLNFDKMRIEDGAQVKVLNFATGNAKIDVLSGITVGKSFIRFDLNFIKLFKDTGDLLFDYASDHSQARLNVEKDLL